MADAADLYDEKIIQKSRNSNIDIAIDLNGYTADGRPGVFANRAAPIQINHLGYPGTMGAEYIDYIIADQEVIPPEALPYYSEKVIYLPECYQVNDSKRKISDKKFSKNELGLPESGFVFCCFNNNYKITPEIFDCWMRILQNIEGSVLWLLKDNEFASQNLRREAERRGISSSRLVFADRMSPEEHLARHNYADLFLDTYPCNAHTTASDSLWAELPLLTLAGQSFASRVAASLLNALNLQELITFSIPEYEAIAIELAKSPSKLETVKHKLSTAKLEKSLFNTEAFARNLERAYTAVHSRHLEGKVPDHIDIF
jgi:predicted O-linked N-acetylglucosamine transferase (SPINDLY family)